MIHEKLQKVKERLHVKAHHSKLLHVKRSEIDQYM